MADDPAAEPAVLHLVYTDAEKAVLGALLTNGSNMGAVVDTVTSILKSEDFYRDAHRIIYDAIL